MWTKPIGILPYSKFYSNYILICKDMKVPKSVPVVVTTTLDIRKGVHQGGCCSSIYFLVTAEILAIALRENQRIEGITIHDIKNLLNQFADDMDIFSLCNQHALKEIFNELERFRKQSGFTVSYEKTTLYRIGSLRHSNAQINGDINVLGTTITHEDLTQENYKGLVDKTRQILNAWHHRGLSLIGKVHVVNTLIASLFVHKMMVITHKTYSDSQEH